MHLIGFAGAPGHGKSTAARHLRVGIPSSQDIEVSSVISEVVNQLNANYPLSGIKPDDFSAISSWVGSLEPVLSKNFAIDVPSEIFDITANKVDSNPSKFQKLKIYLDRLNDNPELSNAQIDEENKEIYRPILQWLGGYLVENLADTLWFDEIIRRSEFAREDGCKLFTVCGVRYPKDQETIHHVGGKVLVVQRGNVNQGHDQDPTEAQRSEIIQDAIIYNNGSADDLRRVMGQVQEDIFSDRLQKVYRAI